jgi:two-component system, NtrC family, nitrogen regulation sensor histidine kinase NtrY
MSENSELSRAKPKDPQERRRRILLWILGGTVVLLLAIIVSQQLWLWTVVRPDTHADAVVLYALSTLNFVAFVVFLFIFVRNLLKLRWERRERQLGSKVKTRLLFSFVAISFLPITAMAFFSYLFLNRSLEKWFNPFPDEIKQQATEVSRSTLSSQDKTLRDTASLLIMLLVSQTLEERQATMQQVVNSGQLVRIEIAGKDSSTFFQSPSLTLADSEQLEKLFSNARLPHGSDGLNQVDGKEFDALAVPLSQAEMLIIAPQKHASNDLSDLVADSERDYQDLVRKQRRVRLLGLSTLGLMTLILLFVSSWVAIYLARGIVSPIRAVAEGFNEVAKGNLSFRVTTVADEELALLAESFNQMIGELAELEENRSRTQADAAEQREKNLALERRRKNIETVLDSLAAGVISVDDDGRLTTINSAAARLLELEKSTAQSQKLLDLIPHPDRALVGRLLALARQGGGTNPTRLSELTQFRDAKALSLIATVVRMLPGQNCEVVLVIQELSELGASRNDPI